MSTTDSGLPAGARKLSPLEMNKLAILKAHTVITFTAPPSEDGGAADMARER